MATKNIDICNMKNYTTFLKIGGEGGSIKINKILIAGNYKYWFGTNESAMADFLSEEDLKGISLTSKSEFFDTFEEAFNTAKNKYPIFKLYLIAVADEVKEFVADEYRAYIQTYKGPNYRGSSWENMFGEYAN